MATALLKLHTDLVMDHGKVAALILLASSAAFVSINHTILMARLFLWYGVSGVNIILVVVTRELILGIVCRHHLIFRVLFLMVQF